MHYAEKLWLSVAKEKSAGENDSSFWRLILEMVSIQNGTTTERVFTLSSVFWDFFSCKVELPYKNMNGRK